MSDLLQVAAPVTPKNYTLPTKNIIQTDEIFDLVDLSKVLKSSDRSEQPTQQDASFDENAGAVKRLPMLIAKDPSLTASSLKALLSSEVLTQISESGNTALLEKLTEFASEVLLSPDQLLADLKNQQKSATLFTGDLFALLRGIASQSSNPEVKAGILAFLKATVNAASGEEILNSLSANLKFLSEQLAGNRSLSGKLFDLSLRFKAADAAENFAELKNQVQSLLKDVSESLLLTERVKNQLPLITHNLSRFSDNTAGMKDSFAKLLDLLSNKDLKSALTQAFTQFAETGKLSAGVREYITGIGESFLEAQTALLAREASATAVSPTLLRENLSWISAENGTASLREILMQVVPGAEKALDAVLSDFDNTKDLNALLGRLSEVLNSIDSMDVKIPLAQKLNEALGLLAKSENIRYTPPSSMENLVNFLSKNINDAALKSLSAFNANEMVQSLLTAPGVFTPLLHYLIPVQEQDTRAYGELWVDNNAGGNSGADENASHLFLSFSVEYIGDFELELFVKSTELSVTLLCPPELTKSFAKLRSSIPQIAAANGFTSKTTSVEPLRQKRNLVDVFPRIREKRMGLNVTV